MLIKPIEAMADAIQVYEGWRPGTVSYRNRNPGNLRDSPFKKIIDERGYAVFGTFISGRTALEHDLLMKVQGKTSHNLKPESTLQELFDIYAPRKDRNDPGQYAKFVCGWISKALERELTPASTLAELDGDTLLPAVGIGEE